MQEKYEKYLHHREGDFVKVEIRDGSYRIIYKAKFHIRDKNKILELLRMLEKFAGFSIYQLIRDKLKVGEWW